MSQEINISLVSKETPTVNLSTTASGDVQATVGDTTPIVSFIATGEKGATGATGSASITDGSITNAKLASSSVSSSKLASASVSSSKLRENAVTTTKIADHAVTAGKIALGSLTEALIDIFADGAIKPDKLKPGSLLEENFAAQSVGTNVIKNESVTAGKLANGIIETIKIVDNAVTTAKIATDAVTGNEIQNSVTLNGTVTLNHLDLSGSSPAVIKGPDADALHIKTNTVVNFLNTSDTIVASVDQQGNLTLSGTVDGIDLAVAVPLNTAKVGITPDQANAIIANTIKTGITTEQASAITANTAKVGITTSQANAITANTAKPDLTVDGAGTVHPNNYTDTNTQLTQEQVEDFAGDLIESGNKTGISVTYDDANDAIDMVVDHDAATNFVAEEHYRWDNDIQSTATINHLNLSSDTPGETEVLVMNDGDAVWGHGEKIHIQVRNDEGSTIPAGAPLYSKGEIGGSNRILVGVCDANDSAKMPCIGIAHSEMNTTSTKDNFAVVSGIYNTNLSGFTSLAVGDNLYVQDNGSLSQTKPTGETSLIQNVAIVLRTNGSICHGMLVSAIGRTNDVPNLNSGYIFYGNGSNQAVSTQLSTLLPPDLTVDGAGTVHANNYTNTTYSIQDGELSQNNFTDADHTKLNGIEANATADQTQADINALGITAIGVTGATDADVEITSDGEVTVKLDANHDELNQKFKVVNNSGTEKFSVSESGVATFTGDVTVNTKITNTGTDNDLTLESDGSMTFVIDRDNDEASQSFSFKNYNVEVANLDEAGNLSIEGDLTVKGNDIKDDDGTTCITFDSSGNVTTNLLTCTTSAEAALTLNHTLSNGSPFIAFSQDGARRSFIQHHNTDNTIKIASEYGRISLQTGTGGAETAFLDIENDGVIRFGAVDADSVLTTDGNMTFRIDADNDETSQKFAFQNNASTEVASIDESGKLQIDGDLTVSGNDIKDSGGNSIISSDGSGVVTMAGGNIAVGGSNANLNMNSGSDIILEADNNGGSNTSTIQYPDSGGTNRIILGADSDVAILSNRAANGTVQIRANSSTAGGSGEVTVVTVEDDKVTISQDLDVTGNLTVNGSVNKSFQQFNLSFADDIGSTQHYLSWRDQYEQSSISSDLTDTNYLVPANGRVKCVYIRVGSRVYSRTMTVRVYSQNAGFQQGQVLQEAEATSISSSDDFEVFAFYFDAAEHFQAGDSIKISVQDSADSGNTQIYHVTAVLEFDYTQMGRTTSGELA